MWKPGQLVTINGVVYRVKRNHDIIGTCQKCALNEGKFCMWNNLKGYPLSAYDYLVRLSPVIVMK